MRMVATMVTSLLVLSGCSSIPKGLPAVPVNVGEVLTTLHCELASVYDTPSASQLFNDWTAGAQLNLKVSDLATSTPGLTFKPKVLPAKLTLPGSATLSDTGSQELQVRDVIVMANLDPATPTGRQTADHCAAISKSGKSLGLGSTLQQLAIAADTGGVGTISLDKTSMTIKFVVSRAVDGGLSFESTYVNASVSASKLSKTLDNTIVLAFERNTAAAPLLGVSPQSEVGANLDAKLDTLTKDDEKDTTITLAPGQTITIE
jgi:hypothetical protein